MANEPVSAENVLKVTQDLAAIIQKQFLLVQAIQAVLIANDLLNLDELNIAIESIQAGEEVMTAVQTILEAKKASGTNGRVQ
jgi:hypothetical protein